MSNLQCGFVAISEVLSQENRPNNCRYEIERAVIEGKLPVEDIPKVRAVSI